MCTFRSIVLGLTVTALSASAAWAQKVSYDYQRRVDFSRLRTFSFAETAPVDEGAAETTLYGDLFTKERTEAAIARELQARGLTRDDAHPDVYVTARRTFETEYLTYGPYDWWGRYDGMGYQYTNYGGPWSGYSAVVGTLTIDVSNSIGELLWRGITERTVHAHAKPAERTEHINREVAKVFKKFPSAGAVGTTGHNVPKAR